LGVQGVGGDMGPVVEQGVAASLSGTEGRRNGKDNARPTRIHLDTGTQACASWVRILSGRPRSQLDIGCPPLHQAGLNHVPRVRNPIPQCECKPTARNATAPPRSEWVEVRPHLLAQNRSTHESRAAVGNSNGGAALNARRGGASRLLATGLARPEGSPHGCVASVGALAGGVPLEIVGNTLGQPVWNRRLAAFGGAGRWRRQAAVEWEG